MAAGRVETEGRKTRESESQNEEEIIEEEEPNFSDAEDFVDDITDEGMPN